MDYGKALRKLRIDTGMTQQALAERLSVTAQAVSKWENGVNQPDISTLQELCKLFGVTVDEFLLLAKGEPKTDATPEERATESAPAAAQEAPISTATPSKKAPVFSRDYPWYFVAGGLFLAMIAFVVAAVLVFARTTKLTADQVYTLVNPSVFYIEVETEDGKQGGSGFFIDSHGTAVTNYHVIEGGTSARIRTADGKLYQVKKVLGASENRDLAILEVDIRRSAGVSMSYKVKMGETVYAIGYPESHLFGSAASTFTDGVVSKSDFYVNGQSYIQTNANITRGNSGGVLVNARGKVVGVTTGQVNISGVNYMNLAIPVGAVNGLDRNINLTLKEYFAEEEPPQSDKDGKVTVSFYNGSNLVTTREVVKGERVEAPEDTYAGYNFGGWFSDAACTKRFDFSTCITERTSIYGKFDPITYYVSYDANGGTGTMTRREVKYGDIYILEANMFAYTRYSFSHWEATIGGETKTYEAGARLSNLTTEDGAEIVFRAKWERWSYNVSFSTGGGNKIDPIKVYEGEEFLLPSCTRYGYKLIYWKYNNKTYAAGTAVKDLDESFTLPGVTLTAMWAPITFTVRFHSGTEYDQEEKTVSRVVAYGDPAPNGATLFPKTGYTFWRWEYVKNYNLYYVSDGAPIEATNEEGAVVDFYSRWNPISYIVEYDCDGDGKMDGLHDFESKVNYDERVWVWNSYAGTREGMAIDHWVLKTSDGRTTECKDGSTILGAESKEGARCRVTAVWRALVYEVVYYIPDSPNINDEVSWGEKYVIRGADTVSRAGYTITGWTNSSSSQEILYEIGQEVENLCSREGQSIWLYGVWQAHTYTVQFSAPEADSGEMEAQTFVYDEEQALAPNTFVREGYYFTGWQFGETIFLPNESVKNLTPEDGGTVTLTAVWEKALEGNGSAGNPYLVSDFEDLQKLEFYVTYIEGGRNAHYALTADIDAKGAEFTPIGNAHPTPVFNFDPIPLIFAGSLDGRGHVIKNIVFTEEISTSSRYSFAGLFARIEDGTVKNLGIVDYSIDVVEGWTMSTYYQNRYYVGPLAGFMENSVVENVFASGTISVVGGARVVYVGGLVGRFTGTMKNSYALGTIAASAQGGSTGGTIEPNNTMALGGLVGYASTSDDTIFEYCYADVDVTGSITGSSPKLNAYLGGFLGLADESSNVTFRFSFANGDVQYACTTTSSPVYSIDIGLGRFVGKAEGAVFRGVYANAESRLRLNGASQTEKNENMQTAYFDEFTNFGWIKENLKFSDEIWTAKEGELPILKLFEEAIV